MQKKKRTPRFVKESKKKVEKVRKNLLPVEQETIIVYNKADTQASLFTYQKALIKNLVKMGAEVEWTNKHGGTSLVFPKSWVRNPLVPRNERE